MCHRSHDWVECSKGEKEDSVSGGTSRFSGDLFPFDGEIYPCYKSRTEKTNSRTKDKSGLTETFKEEVRDLNELTKRVEQKIVG